MEGIFLCTRPEVCNLHSMSIRFRQHPLVEQLYPFTVTRNAEDLRIGILTIREKWELLALNYPDLFSNPVTVPSHIVPDLGNFHRLINGTIDSADTSFSRPWHLFQLNDTALWQDFQLVTMNRQSAPVPESVTVIGPAERLFIEPDARIYSCTINTSTGPVYIAAHAEIMEGSTIRGPFALGTASVVKMGTRIYGATTIGPYSVVGGELKNVVIMGFSNKGHDGYLGDSVIGEWCNLGAGTSNSNLKNNGAEVRVWSKSNEAFRPTGTTKCGLLMGDYSRAAIGTLFSTGTLVGVCCNVFGTTHPPRFIPDFTWGTERYQLEKALRDIQNWKLFKQQEFSVSEMDLIKRIYEL